MTGSGLGEGIVPGNGRSGVMYERGLSYRGIGLLGVVGKIYADIFRRVNDDG